MIVFGFIFLVKKYGVERLIFASLLKGQREVMYKYIFGPVPSRRLGISLGVDLVVHKTCSLDCIYCECGKTTDLTLKRKEYVKIDDVLREVDDYFLNNSRPDYITFSGSGEPTLNIGIGRVIDHLKDSYDVPVCVLTNGTLLNDVNVRKDLLRADIVMPSLDSCLESSLEKINRPEKSIDIKSYIEGIAAFKREFKGSLDLEIFIIPGINDSTEDMEAFKNAVDKIKPDSVLLNSLDRPGAVSEIRKPVVEDLERIKQGICFENTKIIAKGLERKKTASYRLDKENSILGTILRRPCTKEDLCEILGLHIHDISKYLDVLAEEGKVVTEKLPRGIFYKVKDKG